MKNISNELDLLKIIETLTQKMQANAEIYIDETNHLEKIIKDQIKIIEKQSGIIKKQKILLSAEKKQTSDIH